MIYGNGKRLSRWFPSFNMPGGKFRLISTLYDWSGPNGSNAFPVKRCASCNVLKDPFEFLTSMRVGADGYLQLIGGDECATCVLPADFAMQFDKCRRARVRIESLRDERGEPYRLFDKKSRQWLSVEKVGIRRMTPLGNTLRLQPYQDRTYSHRGVKYGQARM